MTSLKPRDLMAIISGANAIADAIRSRQRREPAQVRQLVTDAVSLACHVQWLRHDLEQLNKKLLAHETEQQRLRSLLALANEMLECSSPPEGDSATHHEFSRYMAALDAYRTLDKEKK